MRAFVFLLFPIILFSCSLQKTETATTSTNTQSKLEIQNGSVDVDWKIIRKTPEEWKSELSDIEYHVLREKGTERPGTGDLLNNKKKGVYTCRGCQLPLFHSNTKFDSGTGWPSYYQPIKKGNVVEETDMSHGMVRVEVLCGRCDGHLGHVFEDGPEPTGLRYCINSVSLDFIEE